MREVRDSIAQKLETTTLADLVIRAKKLGIIKDTETDFVI